MAVSRQVKKPDPFPENRSPGSLATGSDGNALPSRKLAGIIPVMSSVPKKIDESESKFALSGEKSSGEYLRRDIDGALVSLTDGADELLHKSIGKFVGIIRKNKNDQTESV